jgi:peptide/nickel transport system substrate-binding protein
MVMRRNPYYWKVDPAGNQLPYIDQVRITYIKSPEVALLNATAGAIDFEHGRVSYVGGPILYQSQQSGDYSLVGAFPKPLFSVVQIQQAWIARALRGELPDQRPDDGKLAELLRNPQFVEALVHSIDTEQLTRAYVGADLAEVMGESFPQIPYLSMNGGVGTYTDHPEVQELWDWLSDYQTFDLARSNALLDELGLTVGSDGFRQYPDGGRIELPIGIWDGNQKNFELTTIQGEVFERELKLKTFVQMGSRAEHLQTWLFNSEMPILGSSARVYDWVGSVSSPLSSLNGIHGGYPIINWLRSDGAQGVEPFPEQIPVLKRLKELGTESGQTMDMGRRLELGIEAAQLVTRNNTTGVIVLAGQQALPWYMHNRIKNYVGGATKDQSEVHIETWYIDE